MSARLVSALSLVALSALGCTKTGRYGVIDAHHEAVPDRLDGRWFQRTITTDDNGILAIELVYCPITPFAPTICRTAVVWQSRTSKLLDAAPKK